MIQYSNEIGTKLQELGETIGLEPNDIQRAKRTMRSMLSMLVITGIVALLGKIITSQLDPSGLYYLVVSIKDFGMLSRFF